MQKYIKNQSDRFEANTSQLRGIPKDIVSSHVAPNLNRKDILSLRMTCKSFFYNDPLEKIMKSKPWNYKIFQTRDGTLIFSQNEGKLIFLYSYRQGTHYVEVVELPKIVQCYSFSRGHIFVCTEANELFSIQDFDFHYFNNNKPQFKKVPIPGDLGIVQICGNYVENLFLLKNGAIAYLETNMKQINREDFIFFPEITFNCKQIALYFNSFFLLSEQNELFKINMDRSNNNYCLSDIKVKLDNNDKIVKLFATGPCIFLVTEQGKFYGCGVNQYGELGIGTFGNDVIEQFVEINLEAAGKAKIIDVVGYRGATFILLDDGVLLRSGEDNQFRRFVAKNLTFKKVSEIPPELKLTQIAVKDSDPERRNLLLFSCDSNEQKRKIWNLGLESPLKRDDKLPLGLTCLYSISLSSGCVEKEYDSNSNKFGSSVQQLAEEAEELFTKTTNNCSIQ